MDETMITKKELLEQTGISYGSLYRWKRMHLIPDDWFIHKATFTGHETFFPREKILERVAKIMELRDSMTLEEIAETFSPSGREVSCTVSEAVDMGIASKSAAELFMEKYDKTGTYGFEDLFSLYLFGVLLKTGLVTRDDAFAAVDLCAGSFAGELKFIRKLGVCFAVLAPENTALRFDSDAVEILSIPLDKTRTELKEIFGKGR
jgi:hypothetical protein